MYSIGEFSKISGLSIKALRFYHEQGVLVPSCVDPDSGYRYYSASKIEPAIVIVRLRGLQFSLADIQQIMSDLTDEEDVLDYLQRQKQMISEKLKEYREINSSLSKIIESEKEARKIMSLATFEVEEKELETILIAAVRMQGKYSDCGEGFSKIGRKFGRHICGKPFLLHHDSEYREDDANFEACIPIRKGTRTEEIDVRELVGGHCLALLHQGSYDDLGRSYGKIMAYLKEKELEIEMPTREVYVKGPGMIFKGNPQNYLTELQIMTK